MQSNAYLLHRSCPVEPPGPLPQLPQECAPSSSRRCPTSGSRSPSPCLSGRQSGAPRWSPGRGTWLPRVRAPRCGSRSLLPPSEVVGGSACPSSDTCAEEFRISLVSQVGFFSWARSTCRSPSWAWEPSLEGWSLGLQSDDNPASRHHERPPWRRRGTWGRTRRQRRCYDVSHHSVLV